jgi:hypothetical protein
MLALIVAIENPNLERKKTELMDQITEDRLKLV